MMDTKASHSDMEHDDLLESQSIDNKRQNVIQTRCNPRQNVRVFQRFKTDKNFTDAIKQLGLEGLLEMRVTRLQRELCAELATRVDVQKKVLKVHGHEIHLTYSSVTRVLGLPSTGKLIPSNIPVDDQSYGIICGRFRLPLTGHVSVYDLLSYLEGVKTIDEEFKCKFLLFSIATMLRPTTNVHIYFREFIPLMYHLDKHRSFNWAKFVLDGLLEAIHGFQKKRCKSIRGCLLYLQILYLHNIATPTKGLHEERLIGTPHLVSWTDEKAKQVYKVVDELGGLDSTKVSLNGQGLEVTDVRKNEVVAKIIRLEHRLDGVKRKQEEQSGVICENHQQLMRCIDEVKMELIQLKKGRQVPSSNNHVVD